MPVVPTTAQVVPGATVSIVLKADQRTGRQVQGQVSDLLTRGNHPRGIKVRLTDGRIGRVQSMASASTTSPEQSEESIQRDLAVQAQVRGPDRGRGTVARGGGYRSERLGLRYTDARLDEAAEQPPETLDLMAFAKPARVKKQRGKGSGTAAVKAEEEPPVSAVNDPEAALPKQSVVATCPVCGNFEGDEAAVAHHVEGHFT